MNEQNLDLDDLDNLLEDFDDVTVEGALIRKTTTAAKAVRAKSNSSRLRTGKQTT